MNRTGYYREMKGLAHDVRQKYGVATAQIGLTLIRSIYRGEGIQIDYWSHKLRKVRAAYFLVDGDPHVLLNAGIRPKEPRIFALSHELKHHLRDREFVGQGGLGCQTDVSWEDGAPVEIGAEIFAAEFIFPESEFLSFLEDEGVGPKCTAEDVVRLKRASPAPISYTYLQKRLRWFGRIEPGEFSGVQFQKLEEQMYGVPFYRRLGSRRRSVSQQRA